MLQPDEYLRELILAYKSEANPQIAAKQKAYMKNHFEFYGLKSPQTTIIWKKLFREYKYIEEPESLISFVRLCNQEAEREVHYFAIEMVSKSIKKQAEEFFPFIEEHIQLNSWWDSVDWINNFVGIYFKRFPHLQYPYCDKWIQGDNIWLARVAIIHQLKYKNEVDEELLYQLILDKKESKEFFLQKAAGWALRQYSKFNPISVSTFIEEHPELSALTKREGMKYLNK